MTTINSNDIYQTEAVSWGFYILLSGEEQQKRTYDVYKLARTLDISPMKARLLRSTGKTYVFAKTGYNSNSETEKIFQLYHPDLSCNYLSISVQEKTIEEVRQFCDDWGMPGAYAEFLGQTSDPDHFVC